MRRECQYNRKCNPSDISIIQVNRRSYLYVLLTLELRSFSAITKIHLINVSTQEFKYNDPKISINWVKSTPPAAGKNGEQCRQIFSKFFISFFFLQNRNVDFTVICVKTTLGDSSLLAWELHL